MWRTSKEDAYRIVKEAIKVGYRHIDTAQHYYNEGAVGDAINDCIKEGIIKREDIFVTTKLWSTYNTPDEVRNALLRSLKFLKLDYVDLFLMHNPFLFKYNNKSDEQIAPDYYYDVGYMEPKYGCTLLGYDAQVVAEKWTAMEKLVEEGLTHSIGISNFSAKKTKELLKTAKIIPAMNQIEFNPPSQQPIVTEYCLSQGIQITAFTQFGRAVNDTTGKMIPLTDKTIASIGKKYNKTNAQVILRWLLQRNVVAIPKTVTPSRLVENFNIFDYTLSDEDMNTMNNLDIHDRTWNGVYFTLPGHSVKDTWDNENTEKL